MEGIGADSYTDAFIELVASLLGHVKMINTEEAAAGGASPESKALVPVLPSFPQGFLGVLNRFLLNAEGLNRFQRHAGTSPRENPVTCGTSVTANPLMGATPYV